MYMSEYQIPVRRVGTAIVISGDRQERELKQTAIDGAFLGKRLVWKCALSVKKRCKQRTSFIHHTDTPFTELITPQEQNINTWSGSSLATHIPRPNGGDIRYTRLKCARKLSKYIHCTQVKTLLFKL